MQWLAVGVLAMGLASGAGLAAQAQEPARRILIVADENSIQFRSAPWVRELISRTLRVLSSTRDLVRIVSTGGPRTAVPDPILGTAVGKALAQRAVASAMPTSSDAHELQLRSDLARPPSRPRSDRYRRLDPDRS